MALFRRFLLGLLMVALLPWGAWMSERGTLRAAPVAGLQSAAPAVIAAKSRCRIAHLPGQGCGLDLALWPHQAEAYVPGGDLAGLLLLVLPKAALPEDQATPPPKAA